MQHIRYSAAYQTDQPNPLDRRQMRKNTDRIISMIDSAVARHQPFLLVKLAVFPEFAHVAPVFPKHCYPPQSENGDAMLSYEKNNRLIDASRKRPKSIAR